MDVRAAGTYLGQAASEWPEHVFLWATGWQLPSGALRGCCAGQLQTSIKGCSAGLPGHVPSSVVGCGASQLLVKGRMHTTDCAVALARLGHFGGEGRALCGVVTSSMWLAVARTLCPCGRW